MSIPRWAWNHCHEARRRRNPPSYGERREPSMAPHEAWPPRGLPSATAGRRVERRRCWSRTPLCPQLCVIKRNEPRGWRRPPVICQGRLVPTCRDLVNLEPLSQVLAWPWTHDPVGRSHRQLAQGSRHRHFFALIAIACCVGWAGSQGGTSVQTSTVCLLKLLGATGG